MAKSNKGFGWQGVNTGTPCAKPSDNANYSKDLNRSPGSWQGERDSTPNSSGKSQSVRIGSGSKGD